MGIDYKRLQEASGMLWQEVWRDGVMESREPLPLKAQPIKIQFEMIMEEKWSVWWRWKTTSDEAHLRMLPDAVLTALDQRVSAAWTSYAKSINDWRQA